MGKSYGKSVDLFLYGVLAFEMLTGEQAFPFLIDNEEHEERIRKCIFYFPDEPAYKEMFRHADVPLPQNERSQHMDIGQTIDQNSSEEPMGYQEVPNNSDEHAISNEAKDLIRQLIVADGDKRITIAKMKKHAFFDGLRWDQAEQGLLKMPVVKLKKPKAENFDEIQYDSDDQDFIHEFEGIPEADDEPGSSRAKTIVHRASENSAMYDYTPQEIR